MEEDEIEMRPYKGLAKDVKAQDYAQVCFELSRSDNGELTCEVERAWLGDMARYIVELETEVKARTKAEC